MLMPFYNSQTSQAENIDTRPCTKIMKNVGIFDILKPLNFLTKCWFGVVTGATFIIM